MDKPVTAPTAELEQTQERLRLAQSKLAQNETMSMLGQLAAGIAHEVNTPTGAILNVCVDANDHLHSLLTLALRLGEQPPEMKQWLQQAFETLCAKKMVRSEIAVRSERRAISQSLRDLGYADSRPIAEAIIAYDMTEWADDEDLLQRISEPSILSLLEHALALKVSYDITNASANKIARIVKSLRFYAHEGQGETSDIDVNESLDNTLVILQSRIKYIAQVRTRLQVDLPWVKCGADLLQIWTNILCNACDAIGTPDGATLPMIEIVTKTDGDSVVVTISNEGPPIPDEHLDRVFDPFFTTKPVGQGMGLGLSVCAGIAARYRGSIRVMNEPGRVAFEVRLPITPTQAEPVNVADEAPGEPVTNHSK